MREALDKALVALFDLERAISSDPNNPVRRGVYILRADLAWRVGQALRK